MIQFSIFSATPRRPINQLPAQSVFGGCCAACKIYRHEQCTTTYQQAQHTHDISSRNEYRARVQSASNRRRKFSGRVGRCVGSRASQRYSCRRSSVFGKVCASFDTHCVEHSTPNSRDTIDSPRDARPAFSPHLLLLLVCNNNGRHHRQPIGGSSGVRIPPIECVCMFFITFAAENRQPIDQQAKAIGIHRHNRRKHFAGV